MHPMNGELRGEGGENNEDIIMITVPLSSPSSSSSSSSPPSRKGPSTRPTTTPKSTSPTAIAAAAAAASAANTTTATSSPPPSFLQNVSDNHNANSKELTLAQTQYNALNFEKYSLILQIARLQDEDELEVLWSEVERRECVVNAMRNKVRGLERGVRDR